MNEEEDDSDSDNLILATSDRNATRAAAAAAVKSKGFGSFKRKKDWKGKGPAVQPQLDVSQWKMTNGWPYRYFGQHVDHSSIFDPDDSIWPRASTRIGTRFQALSIPGEEPDTSRKPPHKKPKVRKSARDSQCTLLKYFANLPEAKYNDKALSVEKERGGDEACTPIWMSSDQYSDQELDDFLDAVRKMPIYSHHGTVDILDYALRLLQKSPSIRSVLNKLHKIDLQDLPNIPSLADWNPQEIATFNKNIETYDDELSEFKRSLGKKSIPQIVHFYYREKGHQRQHLNYEDPLAKDKFGVAGPSGLDADQEEASEDDSSLAGSPSPTRKSKRFCAVCDTEDAEQCEEDGKEQNGESLPKSVTVRYGEASINWNHPYREPFGGLRDTSSAGQESGLTHQANCGISLHTGCYGIPEGLERLDFLCDLCDPEKNENRRAKPTCAVCPPSVGAIAAPISALDALKRTDGASYVHLLCALWHHEFSFQDPVLLDIAEGIESVDRAKFEKTCTICHSSNNGACIKCEGCNSYFHVSCAWTANYRFSFEIMPLKKKRQKEVPTSRFKTEEGDMRPLVTCKAHPFVSTRLLYDMGQKDKATGLTALMTFTTNFKGIKGADLFPLLRKAKRLDNVIQPALQQPDILPMMSHCEDDTLDDLYEAKQPYIKKPKVKRIKRNNAAAIPRVQKLQSKTSTPVALVDTKPLQHHLTGSTIAAFPVTTDNKDDPLLLPEPEVRIKKRRRRKKQASDAEPSWSEDEVMPAASTSRSRKTARSVRAVQKADLFNSEKSSSTGIVLSNGLEAIPKDQGLAEPSTHAQLRQPPMSITAVPPLPSHLPQKASQPLDKLPQRTSTPPAQGLASDLKLPSIRNIAPPPRRDLWQAHQQTHGLSSIRNSLPVPLDPRPWIYAPLYPPSPHLNGQYYLQYPQLQPSYSPPHPRPQPSYGSPASQIHQTTSNVASSSPSDSSTTSSRLTTYQGYNSLPHTTHLPKPASQAAPIAPAGNMQ
ncbi:MAG: putative PHD type zinc finger protein with BAH domain-containing protein [Cyphobasidiales sp. Tagirdzhanova-0007]|nr:MAG: putative PHD type zinc finger protein with BAH domain-containing protein [Cyphobasidiales sp. Tagirdzhanova-0007]